MKARKAKKKDKRRIMFEGLPVVDAAQDATVTITKADVANSKKKNPGACAAALAGERRFHKPVKVFLSRMYVKDNKQWVRFVTPGNMAREIVSFDRTPSSQSGGFEPGEYTFKAPSPGQRLGYYREPGPKNENKNRKRAPRHITANVRVSAKTSYHSSKDTK
jgi:hypothetical protein